MSEFVDHEFSCQCPHCGARGTRYAQTYAQPAEWIAAQLRNPHRRICQSCGNGFLMGEYYWVYIGLGPRNKPIQGKD